MSDQAIEPVFLVERSADGDELLHPTASAVGPWNPEHLHGGPTCGAIARAAEQLVDDQALHPARLTVDLFRGVPRRPLRVRAELVRDGRRVKAIQVSVFDGDVEVARGSALYLLKQAMQPLPPWPAPVADMRGPEGLETTALFRGRRRPDEPGFHRRIEARWATGGSGPQAAWFRMPMALVEGETTTAFQRVAALGDFANAVASRSTARADGSRRAPFMNTDTTLYLARLPRGEWVGMAADYSGASEGIEIAEVVHHDPEGRCGHSVQARMMLASGPPMR